jgi:DNA mismatch repair protein MutS2
MIYPKNFEQKIEFDTIRQMVREKCISTMGKEYADKIRFSSDFDIISKLLNQTEEFRQILIENPAFPEQDYFDMREALNRVKIEGSYIEQSQLFDLKSSLIAIHDVVSFIRSFEPDLIPNILGIIEDIYIDPNILSRLKSIINDKGEILDNASTGLKEIRKKLAGKQNAISKKINQSLKAAKKLGWVNDDVEVTIRNGRQVIPVPASHKRQIRGLIHDESATGQTVYIEPGDVLEITNEVRELRGAEVREIIKILKDFTSIIRPELPQLIEAYRTLGLIDFIRAKAKFALLVNGIKPALKSSTVTNWNKAVHPLLFISHQKQNKSIVPLNINLDSTNRILVISGPNAGGKSVCLKTVGLLQYMLQCGMLIPVEERSEVGVFSSIFIDIGDEQSLENDLSTYSSHLLNMKNLVLNSDNKSLFLIDEFGTGTEPQLGGAIAEAVLERLNENKSMGVVTTHYSNLKLLARQGNGIINGAMLFDTNKMEPLYELKIGKPGSSFAFEIAKKIGFPKSILKNAEKKTGKKQLDFDQQLHQLEIEKKELDQKKDEFKTADDFLSEMIDKYEKLKNDLDIRKTKIISDAQQEAYDIIQSSNKLIENTIQGIKESKADKEKTKVLRVKLSEEKEKIISKKASKIKLKDPVKEIKLVETPEQDIDPEPIRKGDMVHIIEQDVFSEVLEIKGNEIVVGFNSITLKTTIDKVKKTSKTKHKKHTSFSRKTAHSGILSEMNDKMANFKLQLDVRGKRGEEAVELVRQYIDDAILLNLNELKILHGKGHGILRSMIHEYLGTVSEIKQYKDEHVERGGSGITIVILK